MDINYSSGILFQNCIFRDNTGFEMVQKCNIVQFYHRMTKLSDDKYYNKQKREDDIKYAGGLTHKKSKICRLAAAHI